MKIRILVVEDEQHIGQMIEAALRLAGYECEVCDNGQDAVEKVRKSHYDLMLLDIMLPRMNGFEVMEEVKSREIPVIFLTALQDVTDKVKGLRLGAEDYIVKPFMPRELIARIQAVLRRYQFQKQTGEDSKNTEVVCGPLTMNEASFEAKVDGQPLTLSAKEFKLLLVFAKNPERVYSREMLLSLVWDNAYVDERTVDVHMLRLRKQLQGTRAENLLQTVRGLGYRAHVTE